MPRYSVPSSKPFAPDVAPLASRTAKPNSRRAALTLMIGTLASRITGLLRTALLLQIFSPALTDAFFVAWRIPNLFRELLAEGALTNSFVPVYRQVRAAESRQFVGALLIWLSVVNALLIAVALWAAPWLVHVLVAEGSSVDVALAIQLTRIIFPVLAAISLSALAMGILNAEERFFAPAWAPVALNLSVIAALLLFPDNVHYLAAGVVAGGVMQLLVQLPWLWRHGLLPRFGRLWHPALASVLLLMAPFTFTTGARQFLNVVANYLLSLMPSGSITAYENANLILSLALGLFSVSPALAFYSRLSANAAEEPERFADTLLSGLRFISFLTAPVGLLLVLLAEPSVNLIWNWRTAAGQAQTLDFTMQAVAPLGWVIFPLGLNNLLLRPFYIRKRVRPPIIISLCFISLNAYLYYTFAPRYGIAALSWTTVAVNWLQCLLLLYWLRRDEGLALAAFAGYAFKVWLAAALAVTLAWRALERLEPWLASYGRQAASMLELSIAGGITALVYALTATALGLPELRMVLARFRRRTSR